MLRSIIGPVLIAALTAQASATPPSPFGRWRTQMHGALVEVRRCPDGSPCAFLVWVDAALTRGITTDARNPDRSLRNRPLTGLPIVWGLRRAGAGWQGGRVYNPETGQTFRSSMRFLPNDRLEVTGCWGPLCRSEIWTRM